jgi:hypothetical protein
MVSDARQPPALDATLLSRHLEAREVHQVYRARRRVLVAAVENDVIARSPLDGIKPAARGAASGRRELQVGDRLEAASAARERPEFARAMIPDSNVTSRSQQQAADRASLGLDRSGWARPCEWSDGRRSVTDRTPPPWPRSPVRPLGRRAGAVARSGPCARRRTRCVVRPAARRRSLRPVPGRARPVTGVLPGRRTGRHAICGGRECHGTGDLGRCWLLVRAVDIGGSLIVLCPREQAPRRLRSSRDRAGVSVEGGHHRACGRRES